ncbi:hypothetical protein CAPTEDRAFT_209041 [Capitella teleta]|uniref:Uncharacterized protein n=1 Tax=Capitella teleta TaxID=283909 RepID=R7TQH0_CAPTE|nr:hypothetical protein CAPTEDRAFT_209041 [Capitella teleta]|eukprot:ELT93275.1 hypothetical protein CAPTEDRAFT_209041 [Capitella teleta]
MDYNLDGVYYMLKYRRLTAEGKRLARIPDGWVEEMAKENVGRKVKHREFEKWRGKLKGTEGTRRYAEERKDLRMERYADGGDGARVRMMVRGDCLLVRANANVAWRYDEHDRKLVESFNWNSTWKLPEEPVAFILKSKKRYQEEESSFAGELERLKCRVKLCLFSDQHVLTDGSANFIPGLYYTSKLYNIQ